MSSTTFNKIFNVWALVLFTLEIFTAGANFADNHIAQGVISLALAGLWVSVLLLEWYALNQKAKLLSLADDLISEQDKFIVAILGDQKKTTTPIKTTAVKKAPAKNKKASK